jgi:CheY-like chemotaxis protein
MRKRITLLLIEEDKGELAAFEQFFKESTEHYDYTISISVKDARAKLKKHEYDVIISNINFIDGHIFDILPHTRRAPFIIITARGYEEIAVMALKKGASDYIVRDVEKHYLQILPRVIKKAIIKRRNEKVIGILTGAFENVDDCVVVLNPEGNLMFANKPFRKLHNLGSDYYLKNLINIFKKYQITGEPDIETFFKERIREENRYELYTPPKNHCGSIRIIPVAGKHDDITGYVLVGHCHEEQE